VRGCLHEAQLINGGYNKYAPIGEASSMYNTYMQATQAYLEGLEGG